MGIDAISGVSGNMTYAVNAVSMSNCSYLSDELIKKLKELGIDPTTVSSEEEARTLIAQAEQSKNNQQAQQSASAQPQIQSPNVDMTELNNDIKALGDKVGVNVEQLKDPDELLNALEVAVKEYTKSASAQSNVSDMAVKANSSFGVQENSDKIQKDFDSIKERLEKIENSKNSMFAGQDMLAMMNRMALGI
jgi:hypothetical protein